MKDGVKVLVFFLHRAGKPSDECDELGVYLHAGVGRVRASDGQIARLIVGRRRGGRPFDHGRGGRRDGVGDCAEKGTILYRYSPVGFCSLVRAGA